MLFEQFLYGIILIALTVAIHAVVLDRTVALLETIGPGMFKMRPLHNA